MPFDDVRSLDAGSRFHPAFAGTRIPTLQELIETVLDLDVGLQLELKPTHGDDIETAEVALNVLRAMWPANREQLFVTSFSIRSIHAARRILPDVPQAFAVIVPPADPLALLAETGCQVLHLLSDLLTPDALHRLRDSEIEFAVATINDQDEAHRLLGGGAPTVLSDISDLLMSVLEAAAH